MGKNKLSQEEKEKLSEKVKRDFREKYEADNKEMSQTCEEFSGYVRHINDLGMYYG